MEVGINYNIPSKVGDPSQPDNHAFHINTTLETYREDISSTVSFLRGLKEITSSSGRGKEVDTYTRDLLRHYTGYTTYTDLEDTRREKTKENFKYLANSIDFFSSLIFESALASFIAWTQYYERVVCYEKGKYFQNFILNRDRVKFIEGIDLLNTVLPEQSYKQLFANNK